MVLALALAACSPTADRIPRVGVLYPGPSPGEPGDALDRFRDGLRELGYIDGKTIALDVRWSSTAPAVVTEQVAELVRMPVDLIVAGTSSSGRIALDATRTIPIVVAVSADPVADGLVNSLARPGGNLTGLSIMTPDLAGKRLELLREAIPGLSRVAMLLDESVFRWKVDLQLIEDAASALGMTVLPLKVRGPEEFPATFKAARDGQAGAMVLMQSFMFATNGKQLAEHALAHRMPTMFGTGERGFAKAGGLMNYGASIPESWHGAAGYVHKILRGAKPAELPVQQPKDFEFVVNLRTAKALGLTLPSALLLQADEVIR